MKIRYLVLALTTALLFGGVLAASCGDDNGNGGGDTLTLEQFLQRAEQLDDEFTEQGDALDARFDELSLDSSVDDVLALLEEQADLVEEFVDGLEDLNPPPEAQDVHDEAVSAGRDALQAFRNALDEAADTESLDEFGAIFESPELTNAFERFEQACFDAQALADENGIEVDLDCGDE